MIRKKLSQTFRIWMALMLSVLTSGILQAAPVYAAADKVFVCKYIGTPFVDERLQTTTESGGGNPLSVSVNAIPDYQGIGSYFADQHGQSFVLDVDETAPGPTGDPSASACPAPRGPVEVTPPVLIDPTCDAPGTFVGIDTAQYTFARTGPDTAAVLTATAVGDVTLAAPTVFGPHDLTQLTGEQCEEGPDEIAIPFAPEITDLCDEGNATWNLPDDTTALDWSLTAGVLSVSILTPDTVFEGTGLSTYSFGIATETNVTPCPVDVCPNIDDLQLTVPQGMEINNEGDCVDKKIEICHATSAVVNPYNKIPVSVNAADGIAGNSGGQADHFGEHTGAIFDPLTNENGDDWGDIIPPVPPHHEGLNWTAEGQAIYRNNCNIPADEEEPEADITAAAVCTTGGVKVTLVNTGDTLGSATVNGEIVEVPANDSVEVIIPFDLGTPFKAAVTVTVGEETLVNALVSCGNVLGDTDVCPNISGSQATVPAGMTKNSQGDCVSGGQVLSTSTQLPATLPATGVGDVANPLMIILASMLAYGATYFLQGRRQLRSVDA